MDELNPWASPNESPGKEWQPSSAEPGEPADLVHVFQSLGYAIDEKGDRSTHVNAMEICRMALSLACRLTAWDKTGSEAIEYLRELNILTSEDVGQALAILEYEGFSRPHADDSPEDFFGLFDLDKPTSEWKFKFDFAQELQKLEAY